MDKSQSLLAFTILLDWQGMEPMRGELTSYMLNLDIIRDGV